MEIFWRLVLAHLLTDFTFQTDYIAFWKRKEFLGGIIHSFIFFIIASILCYNDLNTIWIDTLGFIKIPGWIALLLLTLFHFIEDEWRIRSIRRDNSLDSLFFFLWDQFIHLIFILSFFPPKYGFYPEKWVLIGILFVLITHFTSILIYYIEKDLLNKNEIDIKIKYYTIIERLIIGLTFLLPGLWFLSFILVITLRYLTFRVFNIKNLSFIYNLFSNVLAIIFGIIARLIIYS